MSAVDDARATHSAGRLSHYGDAMRVTTPTPGEPATRRHAVLVAALVLIAGACSSDDSGSDASDDATADAPTYLFSLTGDGASFDRDADGDTVTMTLTGADSHTVWFTDRPYRDSGVLATADLTALWAAGGGFDTDPPNVALVLHEPSSETDTIVAVMREPVYDEASDAFTAELEVLTAEEASSLGGSLEQHGDRHDTELPSDSGGAVSVFIDSITSINIYP